MMFPLLIILANLCVLLASEVEKITCPDGSSCPIGQTCERTATTGTFHCTSLSPETQTGQKLVPALAFTSATRAPRPAFSSNASSGGVRTSSIAQKSWECPGGTLCAGIYCCPMERATCCDTGLTCCSEGSTCCDDGCCEYGASCCGDGCCLKGSSCCGDRCCPLGSNCCTDSYGSGWCCKDGDPCSSLYGYCWSTGAASLPSASLLLAVLLMSVVFPKYFAGVQA